MPSFDSPENTPQAQTQDLGFAQAAFEELQYAYRKDPANCARIYSDLKSDADNNLGNDEERADSCQKLSLLDLAVANIKANAGDNKEASVMFNDAVLYLDKLKSLPGGSTTRQINDIARKVKCKI